MASFVSDPPEMTFSSCDHCYRSFYQSKDLVSHLMEAHGIIPEETDYLKCTICFRKFIYPDMLEDHMENQHSFTSMLSPETIAQAVDQIELEAFKCLVDQLASLPVDCGICLVQLPNKMEFEAHTRLPRHIMRAKNVCDTCGIGFPDDVLLQHHVMDKQCNAETPNTFFCNLCNQKFTSAVKLKRHVISAKHRRALYPPTEEELEQERLAQLEAKTAAKKSTAQTTSTAITRYSCQRCDYESTSMRSLTKHWQKCAQTKDPPSDKMLPQTSTQNASQSSPSLAADESEKPQEEPSEGCPETISSKPGFLVSYSSSSSEDEKATVRTGTPSPPIAGDAPMTKLTAQINALRAKNKTVVIRRKPSISKPPPVRTCHECPEPGCKYTSRSERHFAIHLSTHKSDGEDTQTDDSGSDPRTSSCEPPPTTPTLRDAHKCPEAGCKFESMSARTIGKHIASAHPLEKANASENVTEDTSPGDDAESSGSAEEASPPTLAASDSTATESPDTDAAKALRCSCGNIDCVLCNDLDKNIDSGGTSQVIDEGTEDSNTRYHTCECGVRLKKHSASASYEQGVEWTLKPHQKTHKHVHLMAMQADTPCPECDGAVGNIPCACSGPLCPICTPPEPVLERHICDCGVQLKVTDFLETNLKCHVRSHKHIHITCIRNDTPCTICGVQNDIGTIKCQCGGDTCPVCYISPRPVPTSPESPEFVLPPSIELPTTLDCDCGSKITVYEIKDIVRHRATQRHLRWEAERKIDKTVPPRRASLRPRNQDVTDADVEDNEDEMAPGSDEIGSGSMASSESSSESSSDSSDEDEARWASEGVEKEGDGIWSCTYCSSTMRVAKFLVLIENHLKTHKHRHLKALADGEACPNCHADSGYDGIQCNCQRCKVCRHRNGLGDDPLTCALCDIKFQSENGAGGHVNTHKHQHLFAASQKRACPVCRKEPSSDSSDAKSQPEPLPSTAEAASDKTESETVGSRKRKSVSPTTVSLPLAIRTTRSANKLCSCAHGKCILCKNRPVLDFAGNNVTCVICAVDVESSRSESKIKRHLISIKHQHNFRVKVENKASCEIRKCKECAPVAKRVKESSEAEDTVDSSQVIQPVVSPVPTSVNLAATEPQFEPAPTVEDPVTVKESPLLDVPTSPAEKVKIEEKVTTETLDEQTRDIPDAVESTKSLCHPPEPSPEKPTLDAEMERSPRQDTTRAVEPNALANENDSETKVQTENTHEEVAKELEVEPVTGNAASEDPDEDVCSTPTELVDDSTAPATDTAIVAATDVETVMTQPSCDTNSEYASDVKVTSSGENTDQADVASDSVSAGSLCSSSDSSDDSDDRRFHTEQMLLNIDALAKYQCDLPNCRICEKEDVMWKRRYDELKSSEVREMLSDEETLPEQDTIEELERRLAEQKHCFDLNKMRHDMMKMQEELIKSQNINKELITKLNDQNKTIDFIDQSQTPDNQNSSQNDN